MAVNVNAVVRESAPAALSSDDGLIASRLHTLIVLVVLLAWAYGGTLSVARLSGELHPHRVRLFLFGIGEDWLMFALILVGVLRARAPLSCIIGERWHSRRELWRDVGIAAAFWLGSLPVLYLLRVLLGATNVGSGVLAMLPRGAFEIALWILVAISAGICEEAIFRGYLQRQFMALTGSKPIGLVLAAAAFGLGHLYQGWRMATVIGLYGLMFGLLAHWRRTVRPGMMAHAWQDGLIGVLMAILSRR